MSVSDREPGPPLVFLPGLLCDATMFDRQIERLSRRWTALTPTIGAGPDIAAIADNVLAQIPERSVLIGLSMGGRIALSICARYPERCAALALIATSARAEDPRRREKRMKAAAYLERLGENRPAEAYLPLLFSGYKFASGPQREAVYAMAARIPVGDVVSQIRAVSDRPDFRPVLAELGCPLLVLCGEDDTDTPVELHREMADLRQGTPLHIIPECGHLPPLEKPEVVGDILESWLATLDLKSARLADTAR